jgi:hypothetical protein
MQKLKELIKQSFALYVKKKWLKEIDKAVDRYKKASNKAARERYVFNKLVEEYEKIYGEDLRKNI